mmetsp:Transcript_25747/g.59542  ORF Transcript_25747/g.59542 Transcript_25747/m.59542 type:complete len:129 (+) Transcript_25747:34-420(+)
MLGGRSAAATTGQTQPTLNSKVSTWSTTQHFLRVRRLTRTTLPSAGDGTDSAPPCRSGEVSSRGLHTATVSGGDERPPTGEDQPGTAGEPGLGDEGWYGVGDRDAPKSAPTAGGVETALEPAVCTAEP